jgi:amino acid transporter
MGAPAPQSALGWAGGAAISIGVTIGSGIFLLPAYVATLLPHALGYVAVWCAGGLLALCSAFCYAELAAVFPQTGGYGIYLRRIFGSRVAYVYGWAGALVLWPSSIAGLAHAFAIAARGLFGAGVAAEFWAVSLIAAAASCDALGLRRSTRVQVALSLAKLAALLGLGLAGWVVAAPPAAPSAAPNQTGVWSVLLALVAVSWCFEGFLEIVLLAGETRNAARTVGRILIGTVLALTAVYLVYVGALLRQLGTAEMSGHQAIAAALAQRSFGASGAAIVHAIVLVATASATLALLNSGPRLLVGLAREAVLPRALANAENSAGAPRRAIGCIAAVAAIYALAGGFTGLVKYFGLATALFSSLILIGGWRWRWLGRVEATQRRIPLWPLPVLLALLANAGVAIAVIRDQPLASILGAGLIAASIPLARRVASN